MELADTYQTARVLSVIEREREIKGVATRERKTVEPRGALIAFPVPFSAMNGTVRELQKPISRK